MNNYKKIRRLVPGDQLILQDPLTQLTYGTDSKEFVIDSIRYYGIHIGYITIDSEGMNYMIMVTPEVSRNTIRVFYMDTSGATSDELLAQILSEDKEGLSTIFEATINTRGKETSVTWTSSFGDNCKYCTGLIKRWVWKVYTTKDKNAGNDHCLVDWKTSGIDGIIEVWYGKEISEEDIRYAKKMG